MALQVQAPDEKALEVAERAFLGLQRGAATGQWGDFVDLLAEDVRIMIPVPAGLPNPPEGVLRGKGIARQLFSSHQEQQVDGAHLEAKRVTANGSLVVIEARVEGALAGAVVANHFVFALEIAGAQVAGMYEYASWTAKNDDSGWGDVTFAREAWDASGAPVISFDESRYAPVRA